MTAVVLMTRHYFWSLDESKIEASFGLFDNSVGAQACVEQHGKIRVWKWTSLLSEPSNFLFSTNQAYFWDIDRHFKYCFYSWEKRLRWCVYCRVSFECCSVVAFASCSIRKGELLQNHSFYFLSLSTQEMSTSPFCWTSRDFIWRPGLWNWYELPAICSIIAKVW